MGEHTQTPTKREREREYEQVNINNQTTILKLESNTIKGKKYTRGKGREREGRDL